MAIDNTPVSRRQVLRSGAAAGTLVAAGAGVAAGDDSVEVNVGYARESGRRAAEDEAEEVHRRFNFDALTITTSEDGADRLRRRGDIRYVEENGTWEAHQTLPWGVDRVDADVAHDDGETAAGTDVAIIDTGIDDDHSDLMFNVGEGKAYVDCRGSNCNYPWSDDNDHGTHCAGTADAVDNDLGVAGVSTQATLHALKVLDKRGTGSWSDVAAAIEYTADNGWDVGSMSLGGSSGSSAVKDAVVYAYDRGVLLVASAGNDGSCADCVGYPAAYAEVIAVSATSDDDSLADFSSTGPEVELAAPGEDVFSTVIGDYGTKSGTSMSCPHVSGAGAQLMANGYSNTAARDQLKSTAEDLGLTSDEQGAGLLDVAAALGLDSSDDLDSESPPTVDSLSLDEVETDNSDAEFDASWGVNDDDGDLDSVDLTLSDNTDGETEDTATVGVSGDTASGTTRLVASGDDGSGNEYTVEAVVTDGNGNTDSDTATATESEDGGGGGNNAPSASIEGVSEADSPNPHAEFDISWSASDDDADLDTAELTLYDDTDGETEDSDSVDISDGSASGTTQLKAKHDAGSGNEYTAELVVRDSNGNTGSAMSSFSEDGS